jgi:D-3-phosphoglycerate dehydrogenase
MDVPKVLVADPVSERGVTELRGGGELDVTVQTGLKEDQLLEIIPEFSALVVRSQTKATAKIIAAAAKLKVIGRAGVGVDNVDVDAATKRGVIVMNTPGGNTISTAEHTFSLLMSLARKIPQAHASVKAGKWDRKSFEGTELYDKTLAILGMGRIGTEVARRAMAFGMRVVAYDPYLSQSHWTIFCRGRISSRCTCRQRRRRITCWMRRGWRNARKGCASSIARAAGWSMKRRFSWPCKAGR